MVLPAGLSPATAKFEASHSDNLSYGSVEIGGPPRIRTVFSPGKSRDFTVKVCSPFASFPDLFAVGISDRIFMPTLLLTPRQTDDAQELWRGATQLGWSVHRVHGWKVPQVDTAEIAIYGEPLLATHVAQTLGLELLGPTNDWLPTIPECWRKRSVRLATMREARDSLEPRFVKSAGGKEFDARVYDSGSDLPRGQMIADSLPVLIQEVVQWDVEYRCFISDRSVKTASSYWRHGKDSRNENGIWSDAELSEAVEFCSAFLCDAEVRTPNACVIDVGVIRGTGWAVIESNAAWSSGIYGCDGAKVLPVLLKAYSRLRHEGGVEPPQPGL